MAQHNELGKQGELLAQQYLVSHGYQILECNWKFGKFEIDIIAKKGKEIVFVEVKTRSNDYFGNPEDSVDVRRQRRMTNAADIYLKFKRYDYEPRFDIISIILNDSDQSINHIEDAFAPLPFYR